MAASEKLDDATLGSLNAVTFLKRRGAELIGAAVLSFAFVLAVALLTHDASDPSLSTTGATSVGNLLGPPGARISDILLQSIGLASAVLVTVMAAWGLRFLLHLGIDRFLSRLAVLPIAILALTFALAVVAPIESWPLRAGPGGAVGMLLVDPVLRIHADINQHLGIVGATVGAFGLLLVIWCHGASWSEWRSLLRYRPSRVWHVAAAGGRGLATGIRHAGDLIRTTTCYAKRSMVPARQRVEPVFNDSQSTVEIVTLDTAAVKAEESRKRAVRQKTPAQASLDLDEPSGDYQLPSLLLLAPAPTAGVGTGPDKDTLAANARMLEAVLQDFKIQGEIIKIRSGPVVTLYELEPAPGLKSARVIGLADDIARSMSAISVRVAVVPGRNVIGIELPNSCREMVLLREIFEADVYRKSNAKLPIALGKDISGAPIVVDLATMPHLLIAGTTGSGKSVAVNTMILSLLYRMTPERCRMIMIDPKMLELSIYDGIPHLLSPVVTDPRKAIVALKWTVREMESRYRAMSKLGVRNIDGYNVRLAEARGRGEVVKRRVQTGFDSETGNPVFEDEVLDLSPLPLIVVVIDEVADLMLVAGKDIEGAVQRLAQMARAAGIHVIMATQRPSVDVITGTIKANFPTRISFQVTSKIDSRTILGEQGAEQLLGQGDMLHMAGGGRTTRIHGPFVSDGEVEEIVRHLRAQGQPEYDETVTEEDEVGDPFSAFGLGSGSSDDSNDLYDQAVAIVARERKASTSFIQRQFKIGYNRAALIIERMETEGVVSKANHVGKREVLVDDHSDQ